MKRMYLFEIDGVTIKADDTLLALSKEEAKAYLDYIYKNLDEHDTFKKIKQVHIEDLGDGNITLHVLFEEPKFERIRRITGYLSSTVDTWNNAKRAEERERVKHL